MAPSRPSVAQLRTMKLSRLFQLFGFFSFHLPLFFPKGYFIMFSDFSIMEADLGEPSLSSTQASNVSDKLLTYFFFISCLLLQETSSFPDEPSCATDEDDECDGSLEEVVTPNSSNQSASASLSGARATPGKAGSATPAIRQSPDIKGSKVLGKGKAKIPRKPVIFVFGSVAPFS